MRGCLRNMDNIIRKLLDLDTTSRLRVVNLVVQDAVADGLISEDGDMEETIILMWLAELNLLDGIRENIEAQELLNEAQKDYLWSIVLGGV